MLHTTVSVCYSYDELADLTIKKSLRPIAKKLLITGYSRMNKAALITAILDAQLQESATQKTEVELVVAAESPAVVLAAQHEPYELTSTDVACEDSSVLPSPWDTELLQPIEIAKTQIAVPASKAQEITPQTTAWLMVLIILFAMAMLWAIAQVVILFGQVVIMLLTWLIQRIEERQELLIETVENSGLLEPVLITI